MNEACWNAVVAGHYGVPVVMVSGDQTTIDQTREVLPQVEGAVVKFSYSRYCAESHHPERARTIIRKAARRAIQKLGSFTPLAVPAELRMEIDFLRTDMADAAALIPGVERSAPRTITFTSDPVTVFKVQELIFYRLKYEP